jgi:hypothetical protein
MTLIFVDRLQTLSQLSQMTMRYQEKGHFPRPNSLQHWSHLSSTNSVYWSLLMRCNKIKQHERRHFREWFFTKKQTFFIFLSELYIFIFLCCFCDIQNCFHCLFLRRKRCFVRQIIVCRNIHAAIHCLYFPNMDLAWSITNWPTLNATLRLSQVLP